MKIYSMIGAGVVTFALLFYSIAIISEQRKRLISKFTLSFLTVGWLCDVVATILMIMGSSNSMFTLHGFIGYSALLGMTIEMIWSFYFYQKFKNERVSIGLHQFSRYSYIWWIVAYITGSLLVMMK